jgi:hypothetical protein
MLVGAQVGKWYVWIFNRLIGISRGTWGFERDNWGGLRSYTLNLGWFNIGIHENPDDDN